MWNIQLQFQILIASMIYAISNTMLFRINFGILKIGNMNDYLYCLTLLYSYCAVIYVCISTLSDTFLNELGTWNDWAIFHLNGTQLISSFKPRNIFYMSSFHLLESRLPHFFFFLMLLRLYLSNECGVMKDAFSLIYVLLRYSIIAVRIYHGNFSFL